VHPLGSQGVIAQPRIEGVVAGSKVREVMGGVESLESPRAHASGSFGWRRYRSTSCGTAADGLSSSAMNRSKALLRIYVAALFDDRRRPGGHCIEYERGDGGGF